VLVAVFAPVLAADAAPALSTFVTAGADFGPPGLGAGACPVSSETAAANTSAPAGS
jgi:hypothetical protein